MLRFLIYSTHVNKYWVCWNLFTTFISKGPTTSTHNLQLWELLHINSFFIGTVSVRGVSTILSIVDAKA